MSAQLYGYIRVSTQDQHEARQLDAMRAFGVPPENLFLDKHSGKDFLRPAYRRLMDRLRPGDTLVIKSIDRLGRSYEDILAQWRTITHDKKSAIVVLDMPLLNTAQGRDLTGTLIAYIVLQLLSYVAETERRFIRQRQAEGIAAAQARGVRFGRPPRPLPDSYHSAYRRWKAGAITGTEAAKECGMALSTFRYRAETYEQSALPK